MFNNIKKYLFFSIPFFVLMALLSACKSIPSTDPKTLTIGTQTGYPPFEFINSAGEVVGFDVELAQLLAEKMGKTLVIKDMEFEGIILSLKQGKIDLSMCGMNITPSRLKEIEMIPYHGNDLLAYSLIFWNEIPAGIKTIEDLSGIPGAIVAVESGSLPESFMHEKHPEMAAKSLQGALNPLMDVKFGKSIANLVEPDVAYYLQNKYPEIRVLDIPLTKEDHVLGFGIGVKKGNEQMLNDVNALIQEFKASGQLEKLEKKWFKGEG